jgi:GH24 family phage-related lysozyme (muramidase)
MKTNVTLTIEQSKLVRKILRREEQNIADTCYKASGYDLQEKLARLSNLREIEARMFYAEQEA